MRTPINIILLITLAYGCMRVIGGVLLFNQGSLSYYFYLGAPWALLYGSLKAWHQSFIWRRMLEDRYSVPTLSRGEHHMRVQQKQSRILEHICAALFVLAIAALLNIFSVQNIHWWIGSLVFSWACLRIVLIGARRP